MGGCATGDSDELVGRRLKYLTISGFLSCSARVLSDTRSKSCETKSCLYRVVYTYEKWSSIE